MACHQVLGYVWTDLVRTDCGAFGNSSSSRCFMPLEVVLEKIEVVPVFEGCKTNSVIHLVEELKKFDVNQAHCFDPNEERRLKITIKQILGNDAFNERVRSLGEALESKFIITT